MRLKKEANEGEEEEEENEHHPKELVARVYLGEQPEKENNSGLDASDDPEDEDCEITDRSTGWYKSIHLHL